MKPSYEELYEKYKDIYGITDLHELDDPISVDLQEVLDDLYHADIIASAVEFEKTIPKNASDWQRINTTYQFIKRRL